MRRALKGWGEAPGREEPGPSATSGKTLNLALILKMGQS